MSENDRGSAEILGEIERERQRTLRAVAPNLVLLNAVWGAFWLAGPILLFLAFLPHSALPAWVAATLAGALFVLAMVVGTVVGVRSGRGMKGPSNAQGGTFGAANAIGFLLVVLIGLRLLADGASGPVLLTYFPAASCLVLGVLYLCGAAIFNDRSNLVMGVVIVLAALAGLLAAAPYNLLVVGCVAGGGFVVLVVVAAVRPRALASRLWAVDNG